MVEKRGKHWYSSEINKKLGLVDDMSIDWSKLSHSDLVEWYTTLSDPNRMAKVFKNVLGNMAPDAMKGIIKEGEIDTEVFAILDRFPIAKAAVERVRKEVAGKILE